MIQRGWWIAAAGALVAAVLITVLATRGPASSRAPAQRAVEPGRVESVALGTGAIRVSLSVQPVGSRAEWVFEARDSAGALHREQGAGKDERVVPSVAVGRVLCTVRAPGFLGEMSRLEVEPDREAACAFSLRRLGSVSGTVRCEGVPVAGVLVRLAMPEDAGSALMNLAPEDQAAGAPRSAETDQDGRYRFDRVPPLRGVSLVAASFDHAPVHAAPVNVEPGEEARADFALLAGAHLAGRIVDSRGVPCAGVSVSVLKRREGRNLVAWDDEARARTEEDGRFVTPALSDPAVRMLKVWTVIDGVQQVIQHEEAPPEHGTKDVGTLAPLPGIVQFELEEPAGDAAATLTVGVTTDPPGDRQTVVLADVAFDGDGRIRMVGLPVGEGIYSAVRNDGSAFVDGKFRPTGRDMVVRIPPLKARAASPAPPVERMVIEVAETAEPALVALFADGEIVMWRQIAKGDRSPVVERVSPGTYTLYVNAGDRYGQREVTQVAGRDLKVSIAPDRIGRTVAVLVLDEGKPLPRAKVSVRGFGDRSRGLRAPWAEAGDDGRARLRALPPETALLTITVLDEQGSGRSVTADVRDADEVTVDLAKEQGR